MGVGGSACEVTASAKPAAERRAFLEIMWRFMRRLQRLTIKNARFEISPKLDIERMVLNNKAMEVTLTGPIEAFIQRQVAQGYKDANEVARQALLRWMNEDSDTPPHIQARLDEAAAGRFVPGDRSSIQRIIAAV